MKNLFIIFTLIFIGITVNAQAQEWQKISNIFDEDYDGVGNPSYIDLSGDGKTIAVNMRMKIKVYNNIGYANWQQNGNTFIDDYNNLTDIAISYNGESVAISTPRNLQDTAKVKIFENTSGVWQQKGNTFFSTIYGFGRKISLSSNGNIIAINSATNEEKVRVYEYLSGEWEQIGSDITNSNIEHFGEYISLSSNGNRIAIQGYNNIEIYQNISGNWQQIGQTIQNISDRYIKLDSIGNNIIISANNSVSVYEYISGNWQQKGSPISCYNYPNIDINNDGSIIVLNEYCSNYYGSENEIRIYEYSSGDWVQKYSVSNGLLNSNICLSEDGNTVASGRMGYESASIYNICDTTFAVNISGVQDADCGLHNGSTVANAVNGTSPYIYYWPNHDTLSTTDSLRVGNNYVIATDYKGCKTRTDFTINATNAPSITFDNTTDVSCFEGNDGEISITISGNTESILWSNGDTTNSLINLNAGTYNVTVSSDEGCIATEEYTVTQPQEITVNLTINNSSCGNSDGYATINSVTGGTAPYTYTWSTGSSTNLSAGIYYLTITDNNACSEIESFVINDVG